MSNAKIQEQVQIARAELARFIVDRATQAAVDAVTTCAVDGNEVWKLFFQEGLADAISEDFELEASFFEKLCAGRGLPYSATIVDAYLSLMPRQRLQKLMDMASLKRKSHPVSTTFYNAAFNTQEGKYFLDVLKVFIKHGLTAEKLNVVALRCIDELERSCRVENTDFMRTVFTHLGRVPEELLQRIVSRPTNAEEAIYSMVNDAGVSVEQFKDPRILVSANKRITQFIFALDARFNRVEPRTPSRLNTQPREVSRGRQSAQKESQS